jgi:cholesterol transport system auxiliary component
VLIYTSGTPQATVALDVTLLQMRRTPVATARFEEATPVNSKSTETVTAAFDSSLGDVMRRVVDWTLQQGSAAARAAL